jgi:hypothetical protein
MISLFEEVSIMSKLPVTLYVKAEEDGSTQYLVADGDAAALVEMGEKIKIGVYKLVEITTAEGVARFSSDSDDQ